MELVYRSVVRRAAGAVVVSRAEEWTYLVRALDPDGVATLEGQLTAFGAGARVHEDELPDTVAAAAVDEERGRAAAPVTIRLGMDGRLVSCSLTDFAAGLPHRALGLRVPDTPTALFDEWADPGLVRPFAELLPLDLDVDSRGSARLLELHHRSEVTVAAIESNGVVRARGGPSIHLTGTTSWDAERGVLSHRQLEARFTPSGVDPIRNPGLLRLEVTLA